MCTQQKPKKTIFLKPQPKDFTLSLSHNFVIFQVSKRWQPSNKQTRLKLDNNEPLCQHVGIRSIYREFPDIFVAFCVTTHAVTVGFRQISWLPLAIALPADAAFANAFVTGFLATHCVKLRELEIWDRNRFLRLLWRGAKKTLRNHVSLNLDHVRNEKSRKPPRRFGIQDFLFSFNYKWKRKTFVFLSLKLCQLVVKVDLESIFSFKRLALDTAPHRPQAEWGWTDFTQRVAMLTQTEWCYLDEVDTFEGHHAISSQQRLQQFCCHSRRISRRQSLSFNPPTRLTTSTIKLFYLPWWQIFAKNE